jgi:hypothetical protein
LNKLLEKLGQNPQRSLSFFMRGLGLFAVGTLFIFVGYYFHHYWQILGLFFLIPAILLAAYGYIGMFANRLLNIFQRNKD